MYALMCRNNGRVKLLLHYGADPRLSNRLKWSAYHYAQEAGPEFVKLLNNYKSLPLWLLRSSPAAASAEVCQSP